MFYCFDYHFLDFRFPIGDLLIAQGNRRNVRFRDQDPERSHFTTHSS